MRLDITGVAADFPAFRVAVVVFDGLAVTADRSSALAEVVARTSQEARARWGRHDLAEIPGVAVWRRAYRAFGIRKTSYRSSVERLMKNALAGTPLPAINGFVDAYNAISLAHVLPAGADDRDRLVGDLAFRHARTGDDFRDMGALDAAGQPLADPPKPGEVVYADAERVLCRRWNWRQDARSVITPATTRAIVTLQANGEGSPEAAASELAALVLRECGGRYAVTLVDAAHPVAELVEP